ncbi:uncharacterized protein LOC113330698 [Papaver somniferum]|uniref:uncharacterized protein LOC113330698 n=1 Tax=Papaver somniferum TaxID=3469 RepID=UPI000E6F7540|nr:uncharacterized protein LOC113330698 [Papaver somniferum]
MAQIDCSEEEQHSFLLSSKVASIEAFKAIEIPVSPNGGESNRASGSHGHSGEISFGSLNSHRDNQNSYRLPKMDFPHFDGENPRGWIQKCECYFQIHKIEDGQRVSIASLHLDGRADQWFLNFQIGKLSVNWNDLCVGISLEALMLSKNQYLTEDYFILSFISGLKEEILGSVLIFHPQSLMESFSLARIEEQKYYLLHKTTKPFSKPITNSFSTNKVFSHSNFPPKPIINIPSTPKSPPSTYKPSLTTHTPNTPTNFSSLPPIKRLTQEQMQARRAKGLCYNCDELYKPGHWCKRQQLFMLSVEAPVEEDVTVEEEVFEEEGETPVDSGMEISLHALTGTISGDTIRILGLLKKHKISILIDSGSTHSFIDSALSTKLHYEIQPNAHLLVIVANGERTVISGVCPQIQWSMQDYQFSGDLRLLFLGGCDIILGADWLRRLGNVMFNFAKIIISFQHQGETITLTSAKNSSSLMMMSIQVVKEFFKKNTHGLLGHLFSITPSTTSQPVPPSISQLLYSYEDVFQEPTDLPPTRNLDHTIPLQPNSVPPNQRAYKCPYIQKSEPSHSPFSSPILLVKKKDNSWRFCVDYRNLNDITIKDKFPIPIIDELLDKLFGYGVFTKIDMGSGYHQILVHPSDILKKAFGTHHGHYEFKSKLEYLGHIISAEGVAADPAKVAKLLKKNSFSWSPSTTQAFNNLKAFMVSAPVLALPDFSKQFVLETDANGVGIGAVLMQEGKAICFFSKPLGPKTDHQSIKYFLDQKITTTLQQKWLMKLLGFDYQVQYKSGVENKVDDALSRKSHDTATCNLLSTTSPKWAQ